jgi:hypothetical protein
MGENENNVHQTIIFVRKTTTKEGIPIVVQHHHVIIMTATTITTMGETTIVNNSIMRTGPHVTIGSIATATRKETNEDEMDQEIEQECLLVQEEMVTNHPFLSSHHHPEIIMANKVKHIIRLVGVTLSNTLSNSRTVTRRILSKKRKTNGQARDEKSPVGLHPCHPPSPHRRQRRIAMLIVIIIEAANCVVTTVTTKSRLGAAVVAVGKGKKKKGTAPMRDHPMMEDHHHVESIANEEVAVILETTTTKAVRKMNKEVTRIIRINIRMTDIIVESDDVIATVAHEVVVLKTRGDAASGIDPTVQRTRVTIPIEG